MARYIDADWIYEKVENRYRISSGIEHRCERDLLDLICNAPTADVVPKSEVAREVFELVECAFSPAFVYEGHTIKAYIAELKKKYTEGKT